MIGLLLTVLCLWARASALEFQGCFKNLEFTPENDLIREFEGFNLNADCAAFCASQGYILAATHGAMCYCTNKIPTPDQRLISPAELKLLDGREENPCNVPCPGSLVKRRGECLGDECCGGLQGRRLKRYSLYAVGGIDPVGVYLRRMYRSLLTRRHPWLHLDINGKRPVCYRNFEQLGGGIYGSLMLERHSIKDNIKVPGTVESPRQCQIKCIDNRGFVCQAVTYFLKEKECYLHRKSSLTGAVTLSKRESAVYDRNCSHVVEILPTSFNMDVVRQTVSDAFTLGGTIEAQVGSEDIEVDLTHSINWETTHRSVAVTTSEDLSETTSTGLVKSSSRTEGLETSDTETSGSSHSSSKTSGLNGGFGFSVGASASVGAFGVTGSVETQATANFDFSSSDTHSDTSSSSESQTKTKGSSKTSSRSDMFNLGYSKSLQRSNSNVYSYSLTVPPQHKGIMGFFVKKEPLTRKIVTDLRLNGYLKLKIRDGLDSEIREIHVSRLISPRERFVSVLTEQVYQRERLIAKVTITDPDGNKIVDEAQIVEQEK